MIDLISKVVRRVAAYRGSLALRFTLCFVALFAIFCGIFVLIQSSESETALRAASVERLDHVGRLVAELAATSLKTLSAAELRALMDDLSSDSEVVAAEIVDADGRIVGTPSKDDSKFLAKNTNELTQSVLSSGTSGIVVGANSISAGFPVKFAGRQIGVLHVEASRDRARSLNRAVRQKQFAIGAALFCLAALLCALLVHEATKPVYRLTQLAREVEAGSNPKLNSGGRMVGELGELQSAFLSMTRRLSHRDAELVAQNERFEAALETMSQGLCMFDADQKMVVCNRRFGELYGLSPEQTPPGVGLRDVLESRVEGGCYPDIDADEYVCKQLAVAASGEPSTGIAKLRDGRVLLIQHIPKPNGGWVATHEDITARQKADAKISHMARHDALTDLPNRVLLRECLEAGLKRVSDDDTIAVLCIDLDNFKSVNDTLGHYAGDLVLRTATDRLLGSTGKSDTVARLGGDEFAIIQLDAEQPVSATALAERVIEVLSAPYDLEGQGVVIGASIGIAIAPGDGTSPDELLKNADLALYRAKAEGRGAFRFFEREMDARMREKRALEVDLRAALELSEFELFYQPLINLADGEIVAFEALLRWRHPDRGLVSPDAFIPVLEETGLIVAVGEWVLRQACSEATGWPDGIRVAINLSPVQFRGRALGLSVVSALAATGLLASRLELEITERVLLQKNEATLSTLHQLRNLGVHIAMDDFGTGYSSLSYLRSFPFDKIKIDRSFVRELCEGDDCIAIVRAVLGLGNNLGMTVTAEGVETEEQLERLRAEGCTEVQGYLLSRPKPATDIPELIRKHNSSLDAA